MNPTARGIARIGTSGIVVPGTKNSRPEKFQHVSRLHYYASLFNTLEVNSTFKKIPKTATFEKWAADVPADFHFTIKLWREITHLKQFHFDARKIDTFMNAANNIGVRKGCILAQFPASFKFYHKE